MNTYSIEQSRSWETNRFSANQEIPRILWNPKIHDHINKCPPPVPEPARSSPYLHNPLHESRWYEHMHLTQAKNASRNHDLPMSVPIVRIKL
jgi:hypothetical protein